MGLAMAPYRQATGQLKEEPNDSHHPHHPQQQQGQAPSHIQPHPRPSSIVQHHHPHAPPQQQQQHSSAYSSYQHSQQQNQTSGGQHTQDLPYYAQQSPYSTPGATSGYTSADTSEMMAAAMPRPPYPPMSYHTPQSNSPASVASPSGHDQQRTMYGQPASQLHQQQSMYYGQQPAQYPSMPTQAAQSPYGQHPQQSHQNMTSQPSMMMSHGSAAQHQMSQHGHASQHHPQGAMTSSPRHPKIEAHSMPPQLSRPGQQAPMSQQQQQQQQQQQPPMGQQSSMPPQQQQMGQPMGQSQPPQNGAPMQNNSNANAAPGPIPATTPLVVRQDQNGVQWIAFEYSRDRVKMEYTIRCDVESVDTEALSAEFKQENCVYPRACVAKEAYRGNRLQYESECNTVGWALAQLNAPLRGKRGLIQRAVDSWRNSNRDPRLRSRRVRRMAKMTTRKANPMPTGHMPGGPTGPAGMPTGPGSMGPGMGKPVMNSMGQMQQHHHHADGHGQESGEVGDGDSFSDNQHHHHHHQAPSSGSQDDVRPSQNFTGYGGYPSGAPSGSSSMPSIHDALHHGSGGGGHHGPGAGGAPLSARRHSRTDADEPDDLFPDIPEAKKRKFILVEDSDRQSRLRVRVTLDGVDTREIPDSFRKNSSVYPRSYFPRVMQSPPPSATGSKFFQDDLSDDAGEDDGTTDTEGRRAARGSRPRAMVRVPMVDGSEGEVAIPRMRRAFRGKEVRLNDLGYRMAWLQSRVFAGRTIFLQRALDCYRNKTRSAIESLMQDVKTVSPHFETRVGKRKWNERMRRSEKKDDTESS